MRQFGTFVRVFFAIIAALSVSGTANARDITILPGTPAASVNALIDASISGDRIRMGEGVFNLSEALIIARDDVSIVGAGSTKTILRFHVKQGDFIRIEGSRRTKPVNFAQPAPAGSTRIHLRDTDHLKSGDALYLHRPNTPDYIARWKNVSWKEAEHRPFRESIHRILAIEGNRVTLATKLPFAYDVDTAKAQKVVMRKRVALSGLTVESALHRAEPNDFSNTVPAFSKAVAIRANHTQGLNLRDVAVENSPSTALLLQSSIEADIDTLSIRDAHNKGGGGNGYGVELREAFDNTLRNLTIENMRHAVIFSAWHAESRNDVHVKRTNRDINFHGSVDLENTVFVEDLALSYAPDRSSSKRRNVWKALSAGGTNHAATDFLTVNTVKLSRAKGSWRDDVLVAAENAVLEGGFGKDRFVVSKNATIMDFERGDRLDFRSARPVTFNERGNDIVLSLADGGEVILRDQL